MSLWSHVWRKKQPTCLGCSHVPSAEPPVRTQDAGLPQVGSAGGLRRWAPAGGREPQPLACGPIPHFTCSYPPALGDTPPSRPVAGQKQALVANRHCQPKAGCTSHLSTSQEEEIALFLCIVENAKADTPKAPLNCFVWPTEWFLQTGNPGFWFLTKNRSIWPQWASFSHRRKRWLVGRVAAVCSPQRLHSLTSSQTGLWAATPPPSTSPGTKGWHQKSLSFARMLSKAVVHSVLYFFCVCRVLSILCPSASFFSFSPLCLRCSFFSFLFSFFSLFLFFFYFSFSLIFIIIFKYTRRIFYTYVFKRPEKK